MLKQGYDHFEVTHLEPKVAVCEKRYVPSRGAERSSLLQFFPDCTIATRGYNFREGHRFHLSLR
jgi:murein L,D-transpeptidase YafK